MKRLLAPLAVLAMLSASAQQASYDLPATLSYYGTITPEAGVPFPAANFVTTNPINNGAWIWVPVGSKVYFKNTSTEGATEYKWTVPGAADADTENLTAEYSTPGTYSFPTLTAKYASGEETFTQDLKIKVGGEAELCHSDNREWGTTYGLGAATYGPGNGFLGGSNNRDIVGVGNFYRFSSPDMYVDGVNIYTVNQPEDPAGKSITSMVYLPYIGEDYFLMTGLTGAMGALDIDILPLSSYKTREDGVYSPVKDYAVYTQMYSRPLNCEGYPYLFFAVEGFESTPGVDVTDNFVIATDVIPVRSLEIEEYTNALAHNSFARIGGESDYARPISMFGGSAPDGFTGKMKSYNFWICPLVRGAETSVGVEDVVLDSTASKIALSRDGDIVTVTGIADGTVSVYSLNGVCKLSAEAANGGALFNVSGFAKGVYIVAAADGSSAKLVK